MNPITYIEAKCDQCGDEIYSGLAGQVFAILRNGDLVCVACGNKNPDQVFKWFSVAKTEPEEEPIEEPEDPTPPAEIIEEIEDLEEPEEEPEG